MKNQLTLIIASATLTLTGAILPAGAYEAWEHVFYSDTKIQQMGQTEADGFCRNLFEQKKATGDVHGLKFVNHVWAFVPTGDCVANTSF